MSLMESVSTFREETLYPQLFGEKNNGIYVLTHDIFKEIYRAAELDPRWLQLGVFEFEPTSTRNSWLYVSSGGSTPWDTDPTNFNPQNSSWMGCEIVLETPVKSVWAIRAVQRLLAYQVMLFHSFFGEMRPLGYGHRVPAGGAINGKKSALQYIAFSEPDHFKSFHQLESGTFKFLHAIGITEKEWEFAKTTSTKKLLLALKANSAFPVTDPARKSVK